MPQDIGRRASGPALTSREPISFLGTVDPETGKVVDPKHQLFGRDVCGKVLIFPGGKGSTVGSYVIYQLKKRGVAPAAMINVRSEPIVAVGAIISGIPWWMGSARRSSRQKTAQSLQWTRIGKRSESASSEFPSPIFSFTGFRISSRHLTALFLRS